MNTVLLVLKHVIPALEAMRLELQEQEDHKMKRGDSEASVERRGDEEGMRGGQTDRSPSHRKLLRLADVCEMFGVSRSCLWRLTTKQDIPYFRLGGRVLFEEERLRAWMEDQTIKQSSHAGRGHRGHRRNLQQ